MATLNALPNNLQSLIYQHLAGRNVVHAAATSKRARRILAGTHPLLGPPDYCKATGVYQKQYKKLEKVLKQQLETALQELGGFNVPEREHRKTMSKIDTASVRLNCFHAARKALCAKSPHLVTLMNSWAASRDAPGMRRIAKAVQKRVNASLAQQAAPSSRSSIWKRLRFTRKTGATCDESHATLTMDALIMELVT